MYVFVCVCVCVCGGGGGVGGGVAGVFIQSKMDKDKRINTCCLPSLF